MNPHRIILACTLSLLLIPGTVVFALAAAPTSAPQVPPSATPSMEQMTKAMTSMAQVCQVMMQREMSRDAALRPVAVGLGGAIGILIALALIALVILEIQWIRLAGIRIQNERARPRVS